MIEIIKQSGPWIAPFLLFIGWTIYVIWTRQEKLYLQRIANIQADLDSAKHQVELLKSKLDQPSELLASVELMEKSFRNQLQNIEDEKKELIALLEQREEQNSLTLSRIEDSTSINSWETFQVIRHEARALMNVVKNRLTHLNIWLEAKDVKGSEKQHEVEKFIQNLEVVLEEMVNLFDKQKNVELLRRQLEK